MDQKDDLKPGDVNAITGRKFSEMKGLEKATFVCKVIVFVLTFGFAFPNIFSD